MYFDDNTILDDNLASVIVITKNTSIYEEVRLGNHKMVVVNVIEDGTVNIDSCTWVLNETMEAHRIGIF